VSGKKVPLLIEILVGIVFERLKIIFVT